MKRNLFCIFFCSGVLFFSLSLRAAEAKPETDKSSATVTEKPQAIAAAAQSGVHSDRIKYSEILITVREDGTTDIDGTVFTNKEELAAAMRRRAKKDKDLVVRICGDAKTEYQKMVDVLDACTESGLWNVSFSTRKVVPAPVPAPVTLELLHDGALLVDGERVEGHEALVARLKAIRAENPSTVCRINNSSEVTHAQIMSVVKALTEVGIDKVCLSPSENSQ